MVPMCKLHCVTFIINRKASREITIKNVIELNSGFFFFLQDFIERDKLSINVQFIGVLFAEIHIMPVSLGFLEL